MSQSPHRGRLPVTSIAAALWGVGCALVLAGTTLPYAEGFSDDGRDLSILDFANLGNTWPFALTYVVAVVAVVVVALLGRRHARAVGGFLSGVGLVVFLDFLGAYVIGPATYQDAPPYDLYVGPVLGAIGAGMVVAGGIALLASTSPHPPATTATLAGAPGRVARVPQWLLVGVIALGGASAAIGIVTIAVGDLADDSSTSVKILGSSLSTLAAVLVAIACGAAWVRGFLRPLPVVGAVLAIGGFGWLTVDVWAQPDDVVWWKVAGTLVVMSLGCGYSSLVSLGRAGPPHLAGIAAVASAVAFVVATVASIWAVPGSGQFWRLYGVIGVTLLATTIFVPVLGRWRSDAMHRAPSAAEAAP